jgi:hypothetical protein
MTFFKKKKRTLPPQTLMSCACSLCWVHHQAHPNELAWWWLAQHSGQGLDHSIVHVKLVFQNVNAALEMKMKSCFGKGRNLLLREALKVTNQGPSQH